MSNTTCTKFTQLTATQAAYDPFANPNRAASEEFGDLLAEGLVELQKYGINPNQSTVQDWQILIRQRAKLIADIHDQLSHSTGQYQATIAALQAARHTLTSIDPGDCVGYISHWLNDQIIWDQYLAKLPSFNEVDNAIAYLGLNSQAIKPKEPDHIQLSAEPVFYGTG
jgi:hypothetical protein